MKQLTQENFNEEFVYFWCNMEECGLSNLYNKEKLMVALSGAAAATNEDSGLAYPGALLLHINLITRIAERLSQMISSTFQIDRVSLLKVCLLQNLSKTAMFGLNDNEWEVNNRGLNFKFNELEGRLRAGERSVMYANLSGVKFNAIEYEAMVCMDREDDKAGRVFDSALTTVIRQSNELATMIARARNNKEKK